MKLTQQSSGSFSNNGLAPATTNKRLYFTRSAGVPINSANTDVAVVSGLPALYRVISFTPFGDGSGVPILGTLAMYTAAAAGGNNIVAAAVLTALSAQYVPLDMTIAITTFQTSPTLYIRNVVANAAAITVGFRLVIEDMTP